MKKYLLSNLIQILFKQNKIYNFSFFPNVTHSLTHYQMILTDKDPEEKGLGKY